jgi:hypothetical protein
VATTGDRHAVSILPTEPVPPCAWTTKPTEGRMRTVLESHGVLARGVPMSEVEAGLKRIGFSWPVGKSKTEKPSVER